MTKKIVLVVGGASLTSLVSGLLGGYFYAKHVLAKKFAQELSEEIDATKAYYRQLYKKDEFETPEQAVAELIGEEKDTKLSDIAPNISKEQFEETLTRLKYHTPPSKVVRKNVFVPDVPNLNLPDDPANESDPYVISVDEFMAGDKGYEQVSLTFYAQDETLAEHDDTIVTNVNELVGVRNLTKFGGVSNDPRIVYVRNDRLQNDFEIALHDGSYAQIVAGFVGDHG